MSAAAVVLTGGLVTWGSPHQRRSPGNDVTAAVGIVTHADAAAGLITLSTSSGPLTVTLTSETRVRRGAALVPLDSVDGVVGQNVKIRYSGSGHAPIAHDIRLAARFDRSDGGGATIAHAWGTGVADAR